jgi:lactoylglutathione lyase
MPTRRDVLVVAATAGLAGAVSAQTPGGLELGNFSVSLNVKDIAASKQFYEELGFKPFFGAVEQKLLIMKSGDCVVGLFQGAFERNIMTFNPGWDANAQKKSSFTDVREILKRLKVQGVKIDKEDVPTSSGPASFILTDPDGNQILVDQHV